MRSSSYIIWYKNHIFVQQYCSVSLWFIVLKKLKDWSILAGNATDARVFVLTLFLTDIT